MEWAESTSRKVSSHNKLADTRLDLGSPLFTMRDAVDPVGDTTQGAFVVQAEALPLGSRVGEYVLRDVIARGGFGIVYRAEHERSGVSVAIKVLHAELVLTREAVVRFEREIQAIRRIEHPHVIRIFDFGELEGGRPYFVMELLRGMDLEAYMRACGRLSPEEAFAILEPVCEALSAVHATGIVHRDFKAPNVFIAEKDGERRMVLLDFGVAKVLDEAGPGITTPSHLLGTPACMAPEQVRGNAADVRTDIYALGALTYYMLTGRLPFLNTSLTTLLHMHLFVIPASPSSEAPVSPEFDAVVLRALAKEANARYQTVDDFLEAFRSALIEARGVPTQLRISLQERRVAALHVEVFADEDAMEDPDEALLVDMDEVLPLVGRLMAPKGFEATTQTGNTTLLLLDLESSERSDVESRHEVVRAALELERRIKQREGRDPRVHVSLCLHAGWVFLRSSKVIGGALMDLGAWLPTTPVPGVVATRAMLDGLELGAEPLEGAAELSWIAAL